MKQPRPITHRKKPSQAAPKKGRTRAKRPTSPSFEIVALAASAGGLTALSTVLAALPADFPATLVVVQHLDPRHRSLMAEESLYRNV